MDEDNSDDTTHCKLEFLEVDNEKQNVDDSTAENLIIERHSANLEEKIPKVGMEFDNEQLAYNFYNEYARLAGFGIRKHTVHKDSRGRILDRTFCCACQGSRPKDKRDVSVKSHRPETRTGCCAMMRINGRYSGKYIVVNFVAEHSGHGLVSPTKTYFLRSHRTNVEVQSPRVSVEPFEAMNEKEEEEMIGARYWELCSLGNQLATRASLTLETFRIAKDCLLKMIEEIDASLENTSPMRPTLAPKSIVQKNVEASYQIEKSEDRDEDTSNGIMIRGWKKKEKKPEKSGKGPRSRLEKSKRNKKQKQSDVSSSNSFNMHTEINDQMEIIDNGENTPSIGTSVEYNSLSSLSQPSQDYANPSERSLLSQVEHVQFTQSHGFDGLHSSNSMPESRHENASDGRGDVPKG